MSVLPGLEVGGRDDGKVGNLPFQVVPVPVAYKKTNDKIALKHACYKQGPKSHILEKKSQYILPPSWIKIWPSIFEVEIK